jgi:hypothetical protein
MEVIFGIIVPATSDLTSVYNTLHTAEEERLNMLGRAFSKLQIAPEVSRRQR